MTLICHSEPSQIQAEDDNSFVCLLPWLTDFQCSIMQVTCIEHLTACAATHFVNGIMGIDARQLCYLGPFVVVRQYGALLGVVLEEIGKMCSSVSDKRLIVDMSWESLLAWILLSCPRNAADAHAGRSTPGNSFCNSPSPFWKSAMNSSHPEYKGKLLFLLCIWKYETARSLGFRAT